MLESVNILMSQNGTLLRSDVTGKIKMKALLTGMPECKFGLNDKLLMDRDAAAGGGGKRRSQSVELEDCAFHRCVRLRTFDTDRTITFVPPDGEFELMRCVAWPYLAVAPAAAHAKCPCADTPPPSVRTPCRCGCSCRRARVGAQVPHH